jgi:lysophospholipase L1-like esterase
VPVKGLMAGLPGSAGRGTVGGVRPHDRPLLYGAPSSDQHKSQLRWTAVANATGYYIETMDLGSSTPQWKRLPWPVPGTSFDPDLLIPGHWYRWRVVPVNGTLEGPASDTVDIRTTGVPIYQSFYALGDSYSSGLGTLGSIPEGYTGGDCMRSSVAWPRLMKADWDPAPHHLACAGAKTGDVYANQLPAIPQNPGAALITITIGGNDVGFGPTATKCWFTDCTGDEGTLNRNIDAMEGTLRELYTWLRNRAPGADIIVAGYPKLIMPPDTANCSIAFRSGIVGISDGYQDNEKLMIRRLSARLNDVIRRAGDDAGVVTAVRQVEDWFDGHEACAGANGEYVNQLAECSANYRSCPGTLHPNYGGQLAYAYATNERRVMLRDHGFVRY